MPWHLRGAEHDADVSGRRYFLKVADAVLQHRELGFVERRPGAKATHLRQCVEGRWIVVIVKPNDGADLHVIREALHPEHVAIFSVDLLTVSPSKAISSDHCQPHFFSHSAMGL